MKRCLIILAWAFSLNESAKAQSAAQMVIASAGEYASFSNGSMTWTIGEVITETYSSAGNFFTQGFNQPDTMYLTVISELNTENISIFPNPVVEHLVIDFSSAAGNYMLELFDMQGQLLFGEAIAPGQNQSNISFREFANGIYLLNITNTVTQSRNSYKINKAQ